MTVLNDLWQLKKAEIAFMVEHWGIYILILGVSVGLLCYAYFTKED